MAVTLTSVEQVQEMDPAQPAPPLVVDNRPGHDSLYQHEQGGHPERMLPLIGNNHPEKWFPRPYTLDVAFDDARKRVYADDVRDVLSVLLGAEYAVLAGADEAAADRYNTLAADLDANPADVDEARESVFNADAAMFAARAAHATAARASLQARIAAEAGKDGSLQAMDEWDRKVLEASTDPDQPAPGCYPDNHPLNGALYQVPIPGADGTWREVDRLLWESPQRLVCTTVDYAPYSAVLPPESVASRTIPGRDIPVLDPSEPNLIWLRPESEDGYLWSLHHAGIIHVDLYPVDMPDALFVDALALMNAAK